MITHLYVGLDIKLDVGLKYLTQIFGYANLCLFVLSEWKSNNFNWKLYMGANNLNKTKRLQTEVIRLGANQSTFRNEGKILGFNLKNKNKKLIQYQKCFNSKSLLINFQHPLLFNPTPQRHHRWKTKVLGGSENRNKIKMQAKQHILSCISLLQMLPNKGHSPFCPRCFVHFPHYTI